MAWWCALVAGGKGIVGGNALLALAGPVGLAIAAAAIAGSGFMIGKKNKRISNKAVEEAEKIIVAEVELNKTQEIISNIHNKTSLLSNNVTGQLRQAMLLEGNSYSSMPESDQLLLGTLVNNTLSLAEMLNKIVE